MNSLGRKNKNNESGQTIFTAETFGVVLILFSTLCLVCLITRDAVFSLPGLYVNAFLLGLLGYFAFPFFLWCITMGVLLVAGKKTGLSNKRKALFTCLAIVIALLVHCITMHNKASLSYGEYLSESYRMGAGGVATCSGGGIVTGIFAYIFSAVLTSTGSYVILSVLIGLNAYAIVREYTGEKSNAAKSEKPEKFRSSFVKSEDLEEMMNLPDSEGMESREYPVEGVRFDDERSSTQKLFVSNSDDFGFKSKRDIKKEENKGGIKLDFGANGLGVGNAKVGYSEAYASDMEKKLNYIKTPANIEDYTATLKKNAAPRDSGDVRVSGNISRTAPVPEQAKPSGEEKRSAAIPMYEHDESMNGNSAASHAAAFSGKYANVSEPEINPVSEPKESLRPVGSSVGQNDGVSSESQRRSEEVVDFTRQSDKNQAREQFSAKIEDLRERGDRNLRSNDNLSANISPDEEMFSETSGRAENIVRADRTDFGGRIEESADVGAEDMPAASPIVNDRRARGILFGTEEEQPEAAAAPQKSAFTSRAEADNNFRRGLSLGAQQRGQIKPEKEIFGKEEQDRSAEKPPKEIPPINREYFRPPFDLLETYTPPTDIPQENHAERMEIIKRTLEDFHINAVPQSYVQGPSITRYEITMPAGIPGKRVLNYDADLKMRLAAKDGVRIEAPIPGKNLVGIEVANRVKITVGLKEVLEGLQNSKMKPGSLMFAIGKDLVGNAICDNLAKGPHYLVAGATGSGKSVCLNVMIVSLIMRYSPEELRLILVDPKRVEFRAYEHIPHLLIDEIITEPKKALAVLTWAYDEMERRYKMFEDCGAMVVDIDAYNANVASDTVPKMPRLVIIIDELADLMESCKKDLEGRIRALAQKARSAGIHLVLATQRPSVDIITGTIKANLPSRIAFKVMNFNDSQTILGEQGAEKLLGNGDMLYKNSSMPEVERYQGAYISTREVNNIVSYIKEHNKAYFDDEVSEYLENAVRPHQEEVSASEDEGGGDSENNEFFLRALALAVNSGTISISQLQRRFQIGYARAGGLVDKMERMGFISGNEGSKARKVLMTREGFEQRFGQMPSDDNY